MTADKKQQTSDVSLLSDEEREIFKKIEQNAYEQVEALLNDRKIRINVADENGMTFLHSAAYKGHSSICQLLIERGADVNSDQQRDGYTALMFAAIGGHLRTVSLLLENGANMNAVNSVGRTAAQLSAFVGQHASVAVINNFIPRAELEYFTETHGLEQRPLLSLKLLPALYAFALKTNINPIRLVIDLIQQQSLAFNSKCIAIVFERLCEQETRKADVNEILAIKYHHFASLFNHLDNELKKASKTSPQALLHSTIESQQQQQQKQQLVEVIEQQIRRWLKGRDGDNFPLQLEIYLRKSIRDFRFREIGLFVQLVQNLAKVELGEEPSALSMLSQMINGQKGLDERAETCATCAEPNPIKKCGRCRLVYYCDQRCQKYHWFTHKRFCLSSTTSSK